MEPNKDPIEAKIAKSENQVSELEKQVSILTEIKYKPGFENRAAVVPLIENLEGHPVSFAFSWGKDAPNMSKIHRDKSTETEKGNEQHVEEFLESQGMSTSPHEALIRGRFEGTQPQFVEIFSDTLIPDAGLDANVVFTRDPNVVLVIKPADCNIPVFYAKDKEGRNIVGFIHSSAVSVNVGIPRLAIDYLVQQQGVDISTIRIGITPGIFQENYFITQEDVEPYKIVDGKPEPKVDFVPRNEIRERNWKNHISTKKTDDPKERRQVDILGATIMQFIEAGVNPKNIEGYNIDSYEAAKKGESYSHRYTTESGGKRPGRFIVVVKLNDQLAKMPIPEEESVELAKAS